MIVDFDVLYMAMVGILLGCLVSLVFQINSMPTASKYSYLIFGIHSEVLIGMILLFVLTSGVTGLAGLSILIRDFQYPKENPIRFLIEFVFASVVPAFLFLVMTYLRSNTFSIYTYLEFFALALKFGLLHLLLQFSGVYSSIFV